RQSPEIRRDVCSCCGDVLGYAAMSARATTMSGDLRNSASAAAFWKGESWRNPPDEDLPPRRYARRLPRPCRCRGSSDPDTPGRSAAAAVRPRGADGGLDG